MCEENLHKSIVTIMPGTKKFLKNIGLRDKNELYY